MEYSRSWWKLTHSGIEKYTCISLRPVFLSKGSNPSSTPIKVKISWACLNWWMALVFCASASSFFPWAPSFFQACSSKTLSCGRPKSISKGTTDFLVSCFGVSSNFLSSLGFTGLGDQYTTIYGRVLPFSVFWAAFQRDFSAISRSNTNKNRTISGSDKGELLK